MSKTITYIYDMCGDTVAYKGMMEGAVNITLFIGGNQIRHFPTKYGATGTVICESCKAALCQKISNLLADP